MNRLKNESVWWMNDVICQNRSNDWINWTINQSFDHSIDHSHSINHSLTQYHIQSIQSITHDTYIMNQMIDDTTWISISKSLMEHNGNPLMMWWRSSTSLRDESNTLWGIGWMSCHAWCIWWIDMMLITIIVSIDNDEVNGDVVLYNLYRCSISLLWCCVLYRIIRIIRSMIRMKTWKRSLWWRKQRSYEAHDWITSTSSSATSHVMHDKTTERKKESNISYIITSHMMYMYLMLMHQMICFNLWLFAYLFICTLLNVHRHYILNHSHYITSLWSLFTWRWFIISSTLCLSYDSTETSWGR